MGRTSISGDHDPEFLAKTTVMATDLVAATMIERFRSLLCHPSLMPKECQAPVYHWMGRFFNFQAGEQEMTEFMRATLETKQASGRL